MKPYTPIDCNFYDRIESAITQRQPASLTYLSLSGESEYLCEQLVNLLSKDQQEFLVTESGKLIRLDHIISLNNIFLEKQC